MGSSRVVRDEEIGGYTYSLSAEEHLYGTGGAQEYVHAEAEAGEV